MTTRATAEVVCENCKRQTRQAIIVNTNESGSLDLDLRPPEHSRLPLGSTELQSCPSCGYVAQELNEAPANPVVLRTDLYLAPLASPDSPPMARRFLAHAVASRAGADLATARHAFLRAAWVSDDAEEEDALAALFERQAAAAFAEVGPDEDTLTREAIRIEALCRVGGTDENAAACASALGQDKATGFVRDVLLFPQRLIASRNTAVHSFDELEEED